MFCDICGKNIKEDSGTCPHCGTAISVVEKNQYNKEKKERSIFVRIFLCTIIIFGFIVVKALMKSHGIGGIIPNVILFALFGTLICFGWAK